MAHLSDDELAARLAAASAQVEVGGHYHHYRHPDQTYEVVALALDEATQEPVVVYQRLTLPKLVWTRSLSSWLEAVESNGQTGPRFIKL